MVEFCKNKIKISPTINYPKKQTKFIVKFTETSEIKIFFYNVIIKLMCILTLISKRSVREKVKEKKFLHFYSAQNFPVGAMIEIIDGNKKTPAIILKIASLEKYKEKIRTGEIMVKKIKLSRTGNWAEGKIIEIFKIEEIKKYLKTPSQINTCQNINLKKFFPRVSKKDFFIPKKNNKNESLVIRKILENKILKKEKIYYNEMQEMVDKIRTYFQENARYGYGSFSYYIGMFKQVPSREIWQFFGEAKQSKKTLFEKKKLFWYKMGKYIKEKNKNN